MKNSLLSLQSTQSLYDQTQERLVTGKRVNAPVDDPANYYAAATLTNRANALEGRLDGMAQAVQSIKAADNGIEAMKSILESMQAVAESAMSSAEDAVEEREALGIKFNELLVQLESFAEDSAYGGINLLKEEQTQIVQLGEKFNDSTFTVEGFHVEGADSVATTGEVAAVASSNIPESWGSAGQAAATNYAFVVNGVQDPTEVIGIKSYGAGTAHDAHEVDWSDSENYRTDLSDVLESIEKVGDMMDTRAKLLSYDQSTISLREDYTSEFVLALEDGSDSLTSADMNEEAANLLALQTSQQLGVQGLSLANQQTQNILQILG
jgi:flagellin-like hook-associated protein FlgL